MTREEHAVSQMKVFLDQLRRGEKLFVQGGILTFEGGEWYFKPVGGVDKETTREEALRLLRPIVDKNAEILARREAEREWLNGVIDGSIALS